MDALSLSAGAGPPVVAPAVEELYQREYAGLVRLAYVLVDTEGEAEEVVQEAFARLLTRWSGVRNPGGYLRLCVLNGARDVQRRRATRRRYRGERPEAVEAGGDHVLDAVRCLKPRQQAVVVLRFYEDMTLDQIAEALGLPLGTVKSVLHRALQELEKVVER